MVIEHASGTSASTIDAITNAIVAFAFRLFQRPLSNASRDALTARILDALGCSVAACHEPDVRRVAQAIGAVSGNGECAVLFNGRATSEQAAFITGMMIRLFDWNDTYVGKNGGHPSDLIAVALAVGEKNNKNGDEVMRALAVGHHLMLDMCDGSNALSRGWDHATYVGIGAVVIAGLLSDLDRAQLANAISMMAASNNMLLSRTGTVSQWRSLASPHAGRNAVFVASLAKASVSGPDPAFEGKQGFLDVISGEMTLQLDVARERSGDSHLKRFPAVFHAQAPIELALAMRAEIAARHGNRDIGALIDEVIVSTHAFAIKWAAATEYLWRPENRETADHSIPFMVALALCRGEVTHDNIEPAIHDPAVLALTRKVVVREDASHSEHWPAQANARLAITMGGQTLERDIVAGSGHASNPLHPEDRARKLVENATPVIGADRAKTWAGKIECFAALSSLDGVLAP
jgi:2-methylcitrate dehydratase